MFKISINIRNHIELNSNHSYYLEKLIKHLIMLVNLVQTVENQPFEDSKSTIPFVEVINAVGKHFNHTSADSVATRFERDPNSGDTVIGIQSRATARDVLTLLKDETNTDISDFGRRLKDIGILLSREESVQRSDKGKEFAKSVYAVGCSVRNEETSSKVDLTTEGLSNESQEYKDELFLWAIGRDNPDSTYARNLHKGNRRLHPVERDLYGHIIAKEQRELKAKRNKNTLAKKERYIRSFVSGLERNGGELPEQTKQGLEKTYLSAARQAGISILTKNAWTNWEKNLRIPPKERNKYFDGQILQIFEQIPGFSDESLRIVDAVEELSKSERWKGLSQIEKVRDIWDVCQTYAHAETYMPTSAIVRGEFECQLKTFLAGNLLKKYVPQVKRAIWDEYGHVKLALQVEGTNYMFDSNFRKEDNSNRNLSVTNSSESYTNRGIGITKEINNTLNRFFETNLEYTIATDKNGYLSVGEFDKLVVSGILLNIARQVKNELAIAILRLTIEISPNSAEAYNNLGATLSGEEGIKFLRKAIEINPNFAESYNNLGLKLTGEEAIKMFRKAISINPLYSNAYYNLGKCLSGEESLKNYKLAFKYNPKHENSLYAFASTVNSEDSLQTIENVKQALLCINSYIDIVNNDFTRNASENFTVIIPKMKASLEQKLAALSK